MAGRGPRVDLGPLVTDFLEATLGMARPDAPLLHVAIDGSGNVARDRFLAYGVVAGLSPSWRAFHREWGELLDRFGLHYLRMTEAASFQGAFAEKRRAWGSDRDGIRDQLLLDAAAVIQRHLKLGGASWDFETIPSGKLFDARKKVIFQYVVTKLLQHEAPNYVLAFVCDDEQDSAPEHYRYLSNLKLRHQDLARRIGGVCFFDDVRMSQIQAADMVAHVLREARRRRGTEYPLGAALLGGLKTWADHVTVDILGRHK